MIYFSGALLKSDFHSSIKHQGLIVELALSLLHKGIKKGQINTKTPKMISMLDPLLPHLTSAMKSRHSGVVEYSLRILSQLVQSPLPGEFSSFLMKIIIKSVYPYIWNLPDQKAYGDL